VGTNTSNNPLSSNHNPSLTPPTIVERQLMRPLSQGRKRLGTARYSHYLLRDPFSIQTRGNYCGYGEPPDY
jgi:hypothetical protein